MVLSITITIGITANYRPDSDEHCLGDAYVRAVARAGGVPLLLPALDDRRYLEEASACCDGFLLTGGGDFDPRHWGEAPGQALRAVNPRRDCFELELLRYLTSDSRPVLGICRGCQALNIAGGGSIIQHLDSPLLHEQNAPRDYPWHSIRIFPDSRLHAILGVDTLRVNSLHHQAAGQLAPGWRCCALAEDGVVEALERIDHPFCLGVQWHPEAMPDAAAARLFTALVECAGGNCR